MTYDPFADTNRPHWADPLRDALAHADAVLRANGHKLPVGLEVVRLEQSTTELPPADNGHVSTGPLCPRCGSIMDAISGCHQICPGCHFDSQECTG